MACARGVLVVLRPVARFRPSPNAQGRVREAGARDLLNVPATNQLGVVHRSPSTSLCTRVETAVVNLAA